MANDSTGYNKLILEWITELRDAARKANSKVEFNYLKALKSLKEHKDPIRSAAELKPLKGFGDKTCSIIDKKLREHFGSSYNPPTILVPTQKKKNKNQVEKPDSEVTNMFSIRKNSAMGSSTVKSPAKKLVRANRQYIPAQGSGGFSILVALLRYEVEFQQKLVNKLDLQEMSQRYCSSSMGQTNQIGSFSGWNSIKTLLNKELVSKTDSRNSYYFLTDEGRKLAHNLALVSPSLKAFSEKYLIKNNQPANDNFTQLKDSIEQPQDPEELPTYRPFIFEPNQYEIILCIDTRERIQTSMGTDNRSAFASALQKQDVKVEIRQLPLGDFIWIAREKRQLANMIRFESISTDMNNGYHHSTRSDSIRKELVLDHIIERKRIDDLACSIKDRRWDEQKYRLKNCGLRRPSYLIEYIGSRSKKVDHAGLSYTTLDQAIVNCQIDGFDVKITDNFEETVRYLTFMTRWLERQYTDRMLMSCANKSDLARAGPSDYRYITFNEFAINAGKIHTFTNKEMFVKHLLQIKGLSLAKIDAIVERYPTLCRLLAAYESQSTEKAKQNLLTDLRMNTAINANRRLGPMISKKVSDFYNAV
ncbi:hypothetical protein RDWZM_009095 [Blomia tropicalis]|uniref:Crossover junction endonuclease MUS81 n=1 Tax=Blomia tropicalis TaxID=40697 RepID=A0A9Q0M0R2_BLOTA|nr:hypothetical protein RDWZM_009095 [Blomia tropicalis]